MSVRSAKGILPEAGRVGIVAPHPDDEVFGTGGLIALLRKRRISVTVIYLTAGGGSHRDCCQMPEAQIAQARQELAVKAAGTLGFGQDRQVWMSLPDGGIPSRGGHGWEQAVQELCAVLDQRQIDQLYCPHPLEVWPDHVGAAEMAMEAASGLSKVPRVYYYLVWAWHNQRLAGLLNLGWKRSWKLNIKEVFGPKQQAIECYLGECGPCGKPYSGVLPPELLRAFDWPYELFFEAKQDRLKNLCMQLNFRRAIDE